VFRLHLGFSDACDGGDVVNGGNISDDGRRLGRGVRGSSEWRDGRLIPLRLASLKIREGKGIRGGGKGGGRREGRRRGKRRRRRRK